MIDDLWVEYYRPKTITDCVLSPDIAKTLQEVVDQGSIPHSLYSGSPGTGKTTAARALCNQLNLDYILINGSEDSGIDVLRTRIRQFASTRSLDGSTKHKVVILDEADALTRHMQDALRAFLEEFHKSCRFIFTCNHKNKIIDALHSRCMVVDFTVNKKTLSQMASQFHRRLTSILVENEVKHDPKVVAELIIRFAPDWRRVINETQRYSLSGTLSPAVLSSLSDESIATVIRYLKSKDFKRARSWVATNTDLDAAAIFRRLYDRLTEHLEPSSVPHAVLILADYQHKAAFVADAEINIVACLVEMMRDLKWKA